jgi:4-hydroxybenzoate polyprenyltransferase
VKLNKLSLSHINAYMRLMRTDKPIGTLLLLWPTLWALWIANNGIPSFKVLCIFLLGVFVMRSAGCVINDFADRKVDGAVKRTQLRPLATGEVLPGEALSLFTLLILIAFILVLMLNIETIILSVGAVLLAFTYPFMKRFTHLPQVVLGAAFSWSIPMAFMASIETVPTIAWLLFMANVIWTVSYDTLYAMVDRDDDLKVGIKSTAILFGKLDRHFIALLNALFIMIMVYVGTQISVNIFYWVSIVFTSGLFIKFQIEIKERNKQQCFKTFLQNNYIGMIIFFGIALGFVGS